MKSLITKDMIKLVQSSVEPQITKWDFSNRSAFRIGRVLVTKTGNNRPILYLDQEYDQEYSKMWNDDVGRLFVKELKKQDPQIYEVRDSKFKAIVRLADKDELESLKERGFLHVKLGDDYYTIIRVLRPDDSYLKAVGPHYTPDPEPEYDLPKPEDKNEDKEESIKLF